MCENKMLMYVLVTNKDDTSKEFRILHNEEDTT